jgi:uncharacterized membrane protein YkoI
MSTKRKGIRRTLITGAVAAGASLGAAGLASAATSSSTTPTTASSSATSPSSGSASTPPANTGADPATLTHGPDETLLTGIDLQKATAAAAAAVPGATIIRAETNSSGTSPYEVHMKKADGTDVTVELDSSFAAITTISGFGAGPAGSGAPSGTAPSSTSSAN